MWLFRLFRRKPTPAPFDEQQAYARSYGDRSGDILRVEPVPPEPEPPSVWEGLTGDLLRRAFEARLDSRKH
ncbi:MAG TPA: hypothetical protein VGU02_13930 [Gaiellaceae bacterium]|nr:hypothetical protein [Gaiellaceae bacterium]